MNTRFLWMAVLVAGSACVGTQAAELPLDRSMTDAQLDRIRGGFDVGDNLHASFALQRTVLVNGVEAIRTTLSIPDIANITTAQATALQNALRTTVVTNGVGGVSPDTAPQVISSPVVSAVSTQAGAAAQTVTAVLPNSAVPGLILQNSLDNQAITANTTIDASVNTGRLLQNMRVAESVNAAVIQFRGN